MPLLYWALEDIQQARMADGWLIETDSDVACHMWLRHTLIPPQKHLKPVESRGLLMMYDARFCFVAFEDLEQLEGGDTFHHTFIWPGWTVCMTRYFYFWATNAGEPMRSTSPIFSKHFPAYPPPSIFYSDPHPEVTSFDGSIARKVAASDWAGIRDGIGTWMQSEAYGLVTMVRTTNPAGVDKYYELYRAFMLFDLSVGLGKTIQTAEFHFWGSDKQDTHNRTPALGIYAAYPLYNDHFIATDYQNTGDLPRSTWLWYPDFQVNALNKLTLTSDGINLVNWRLGIDGIVKLALKEARWDAANVPPFNDVQNARMSFSVADTDSLIPLQRPYLKVVWSPEP